MEGEAEVRGGGWWKAGEGVGAREQGSGVQVGERRWEVGRGGRWAVNGGGVGWVGMPEGKLLHSIQR